MDGIRNQTNDVISDPGHYIEVVRRGAFLTRPIKDLTRLEKIKATLGRTVINFLWNSGVNYIVKADSNDCELDNRVPHQVKVCLPEEPKHVYETLFLGMEKEGDNDGIGGFKAVYPRGPPGYDKLGTGEWHDLTLADVVRDSIAYDKLYHGELRKLSLNDLSGLCHQVEAGDDPRHVLPFFTLPILNSPGGWALTSINNKKGRNYPMMSGNCKWTNSHYHHSKITEECNNEHMKFPHRTGLFASEDYMTMAKKHDVKWDYSVKLHWDTPYPGAVKVKHPIKYIRDYAEKHEYLGHEDPRDEGTVDHKDAKHGYCNKKHSRVHRNELNPPCIPQ